MWWVVLLPKGVSGQFISLRCMCVCECTRECVFPALGSLANSMAEAQLYHYSNMESLWLSMVCLQSIYKFDHNRPTFSFFFSKKLGRLLWSFLFLGYINLKRWCNVAPSPGLYKILRLSNTCAAGVQHKNIDWSLWEGNF